MKVKYMDKVYKVLKENDVNYVVLINNNTISLGKKYCEIIEENKHDLKLSFQEVIARIKENEIWTDGVKYIKLTSKGKIEMNFDTIDLNSKFKLKRQTYNFAEAYKKFKEGFVVESLETKLMFKKENNINYFKDINENEWKIFIYSVFNEDEIDGKWYIYDK